LELGKISSFLQTDFVLSFGFRLDGNLRHTTEKNECLHMLLNYNAMTAYFTQQYK
jgi:hypothetical protein